MSSTPVQTPTEAHEPPPKPAERTIPVPAFWAVVLLGLLAACGYLGQVIDVGTDLLHMTDLAAYQVAADRVVGGVSVYDSPLFGSTRGVFEFVYTPFSALMFAPLAALQGTLFTVTGTLINLVLLAGSVAVCLVALGYRRDTRLVLFGLALTALMLWCEPVRQTVAFGQVNILLMAIVLADLVLPDRFRWKGVLTGIAAGIKLTPAFFVLYLLVTRRFRAAAMAGGSFAATVLVGFALLPKDSVTFWSGAFLDPTRVGVPENPGNETLRGMFARTVGLTDTTMVMWAALAAAIVVTCLVLARWLSQDGFELIAVVLCGLTATVVSPYSWVHHWVWLAPMLIYLVHLAMRPGAVPAWLGLAVTVAVSLGGVIELVGPDVSSVLAFPAWHGLEVVYQNAYIWLTLGLFGVVVVKLLRRTAPEPAPADTV